MTLTTPRCDSDGDMERSAWKYLTNGWALVLAWACALSEVIIIVTHVGGLIAQYTSVLAAEYSDDDVSDRV